VSSWILRRHAPHINRTSDFNLLDPEESSRVIVDMLRSQTEDETSLLYLPPLNRIQSSFEVEKIRSCISRAKRLGQTPEMMALEADEDLREFAEASEMWSEELAFVQYSALVSSTSIFS